MSHSPLKRMARPGRRVVAELLVIVTGVLIALTAENVREARRERAELMEYLTRVVPEIADLRTDLRTAIETDSTTQHQLEELARSLRGDATLASDSIGALHNLILYVPSLDVPTLELLVDTRDLDLVGSPELRDVLRATQRQVERTAALLESTDAHVWTLVDRMYTLQEPLLRQALEPNGLASDSLPLSQGARAAFIGYELLREEPDVAALLQAWAQLLRNHRARFLGLDAQLLAAQAALARVP